MTRRLPLIAMTAAALGLLAACGDDAPTTNAEGDGAARVVEIEMVDIAFEPDTLRVEQGETIRFVFTNSGAIDHDAFIGDRAAQDGHGDEMREGGNGHGGGHGDDDENALTVKPGEEGELTYTFEEKGTVLIGCHQAGHYEAGMLITVTVV